MPPSVPSKSAALPVALMLLLVADGSAATARAEPFDFLFDPTPPRHAPRRAARHRRPIEAPATDAEGAEPPLPVPRPHFASDTPEKSAVPEDDRNAASEPPPEPDVAEHDATPPLPPERPADIGASPPSPPSEPAKAPPSPTLGPDTAPKTPLPPQKPADISPAAPAKPDVAASGATTAFDPRQPVSDAECPKRLAARGVSVEQIDIGKQPDERCTVVQPMRLASMTMPEGGTVAFPDKPTIACATVDAFTAFVHDLLSPLAKGTFGSPVATVSTGPGLECRSRDHVLGAKLSAHGQGLAVDIAQMKLADGRTVAVGDPKSDPERGFETAARAGGCGYFHTVLGPGSDSYHRTHWHFDLEVRGRDGDSKYCK